MKFVTSPQTQIAGTNILTNIPEYLGPPITPRHEFQCLLMSYISSYLDVMIERYNALVEIINVWNINLVSK